MAAEIITKEDLKLFKVELLADIKLMLEKKNDKEGDWLRSTQVRKMLNISANTLQALRINGKLKFTKVGSIFYYKREGLRQLLEGISDE